MAEDLIVSYCTEANNSVAEECQMNRNVEKWTSTLFEKGMWQLRHVRRLAFQFNIFFYLMQHIGGCGQFFNFFFFGIACVICCKYPFNPSM